MIDTGRLNTALDGTFYRPLPCTTAAAKIASIRDFRSDWARWTPAERFLAVSIMAGLLIELTTMSGLGGH